jgi:sterol desaturase/sphingolipid hydroxylase (fatty acid hydroxylase superfamily)
MEPRGMDVLGRATIEAANRALATFGAGSPYGAPALFGALVFAALYYVRRRRARGRPMGLRVFLRSMFAPRIILHPSSLIDLRMWTINALVLTSAYGMLAVGGLTFRDLVAGALTRGFGAHAPLAWPVALVMVVATLSELLAYELAYWFGHYCFHRFPALWEFHKVHHSAEVMTTLTEMRQHPVEILAFVNLIGIATGSVFGLMTYLFGPGAHPFTLLNGNIALMLFLMTWGHLWHSHIWIAFPGLAGKLLQSPAHHQIHHSDDPRHYNRNLGFALAVSDWAFGTLYVPSVKREAVRFGVRETRGDFDSVAKSFLLPFLRSGEHFARGSQGEIAAADALKSRR